MNEGNSNTGTKQRPDLRKCENGMNRGTLQTWGDKLDWPPRENVKLDSHLTAQMN